MVEGPRCVQRKELRHLETVTVVDFLRSGEKVVVWEDFSSDSSKPMWLRKGDIGSVMSVDGDGDALINFPGKDSGGKSLSTIIKKSKYSMLRKEAEGTSRASSRPAAEAPPAKRQAVAPAATAAAAGKAEVASAASSAAKFQEAPLTEEEKVKQAAAEAWLKKEPKPRVVRFTFTDCGPLGLRFSKDVPPWILAVNDGTQAARKAPRVPVAGIVTAVNGHEITAKDCQDVMQGLKKRPVILDVDWPVDQELPIVNRA